MSLGVRMLVAAILKRKGREVFTIEPKMSLAAATALLSERGIGALVVSDDGVAVAGILSERDIVRHLAGGGQRALEDPVDAVMTTDVITCSPADATEQLMAIVTTRRIRHVPVVESGKLTGLVSIGDIVAARVSELEDEADLLRDYISAG